MNRLRWLLLVAGLACVALLRADVESEVMMAGDAQASIRLRVPIQAPLGDGFTPVSVHITNHADRERTWRLEFSQGNAFGVPGRVNTAQTVTVPARGTRVTCVFIPPVGASSVRYSRGVQVTATGPGVLNPSVTFAGGTMRPGAVAHAPELEPMTRQALQRREDTSGHGQRLSLNPVTPADWPADWRVWSPFALVVLRAEKYDTLDGARRAALRQWVSLGGTLLLVDPAGAGRREPHGLGLVLHVGMAEAGPEKPGSGWETFFDDAVRRREAPTQGVAGGLLEVADYENWKVDPGGAWLTVFMLGFAVVIGPLNLFWLAPAKRRYRLFFTVPALSLAATVVLVAVIMLRDGLGGGGERRTLVVLLPAEKQAVVVQKQVMRTGLLLGRGFSLADDVMLLRHQVAETGPTRSVDVCEREAGQARGDWFTSRAQLLHEVRAVVPTRARVEIVGRAAAGAPIVQSSVAPGLRQFIYLDRTGSYWTADTLRPGERVTLEPLRPQALVEWRWPWPGFVSEPPRGSFHAHGGTGELAPIETLRSIRWQTSLVAYTGQLEEEKR